MKTGDARTAQSPCVIIYDEWDKKAAGHGDLASTTGVQNEMLMLLQGQGGSQTVGGRRWGDLPPTPIDSRFSCFFFAGVYEGLADILKKQVGATSLGFGGSGNRNRDANVRSALHEYGYTAEFLNRISAVIAIPDPGIATLMAIATKPTTGIVAVHARLLSDSGLGFRIDDRALRLIAARSMEERTFARGMKNAVALLAQHVVVSGRSTTFTARDVQSVLDDADKATVGILTGKPLPVTKRKQARRQAPLVWADGSVMEDAHA
jgi:ATP-dependent Clp protease ATP-binding subunit ClpX